MIQYNQIILSFFKLPQPEKMIQKQKSIFHKLSEDYLVDNKHK